MVSFLGVPPGWAGALFALSKIWDVITDPLIGRWSDAYEFAPRRRRPFMFLGAFMMAGAVALMFLAPFGAEAAWPIKVSYFMAMLILAYTGLTFIGVPYGAMTAEMTTDYAERSNLTSYRMTFASIGTLIAFVALPMAVAGFRPMGLVIWRGIVSQACCYSPFWPYRPCVWATARARRSTVPPKLCEWPIDCIVFSSRPFLLLAMTYLIQVAMITQVVASLLFIIFYIVGVSADQANAVQANMGGILIIVPWHPSPSG